MLFVVSFSWLLLSTLLAIQLKPEIYFTQLKCLLLKTYYGTFDLDVFSLFCLNLPGQPPSNYFQILTQELTRKEI